MGDKVGRFYRMGIKLGQFVFFSMYWSRGLANMTVLPSRVLVLILICFSLFFMGGRDFRKFLFSCQTEIIEVSRSWRFSFFFSHQRSTQGPFAPPLPIN